MADNKQKSTGIIAWADLTVGNADNVRDFYKKVVGWRHEDVSMGTYQDYSMFPSGSDTPVVGICHARGKNAGLPAVWLLYILVDDLDVSITECEKMGGTLVSEPTSAGNQGRFCVIRDPAGAVVALFQAA